MVDVLVVLGGLLPALGIGLGWRTARRRVSELRRQRERVATVTHSTEYPVDQTAPNPADMLRAEGTPFTVMDDLLYLRQDIELAILAHAVRELRGAALVTGLGLVCGTVGSVWSLYLG